jgi:ankyrin repeat protein
MAASMHSTIHPLTRGGSLGRLLGTASLRTMTMDHREALIRAAKSGDAKEIARMLDANPSLVDTADHNGWTLLCHAALGGYVEIVRMLMERGADPKRHRPIHYAGQRGHRDICRMLVAAGAIDDLVDSSDENAIAAYRAAYGYDADRLRELLRAQPKLALVRQVDGATMLHEAATNGATEILKVLHEAGIALDAKNQDGQTALQRAVVHNQMKAARYLVDRGAQCDVVTAVQCGATAKLGEMLGRDGALVHETTADGRTLLQLAMMLGEKRVVKLLLDHGIPDPKDLARQFLAGTVFENARMTGTLFRDINLAGSVFQNVNLRDAMFHYLDLSDASIDYGKIDGLKIYGVEVAPLLEAELERRRNEERSQGNSL